MKSKKFRTIWLSDIHLGSKGCDVEKLLDFIKHYDAETIILVGDIVDFWAMSRRVYWPEDHNTVVQKFLRKARHGTKIIYIPGNHDEPIREYSDHVFGEVLVQQNLIYTLATGHKVFCCHGDEFDIITRYHRWVAKLGDIGYELLLTINRIQNRIRRKLGFHTWSLSDFVKRQVKEAVMFISDFEENVAKEAAHFNVDAVLCGHIHKAEMRPIGNVLYLNTGDWVESCTAIVENFDGRLELLDFSQEKNPTILKSWRLS